MTASQQAIAAGITLPQMVRLTGRHRNTLMKWAKDDPIFFSVILAGCVAQVGN